MVPSPTVLRVAGILVLYASATASGQNVRLAKNEPVLGNRIDLVEEKVGMVAPDTGIGCLTNIVSEDLGDAPSKNDLQVEYTASLSKFLQEESWSASASYDGVIASAAFTAANSDKREQVDHGLSMVLYVTAEYPGQQIKDAKIDQGRFQQSDKDFYRECGTHFVSRVQKGFRVALVVRIALTKQERQKTLDLTVDGEYKGGKVEAQFKSLFESALTEKRINVDYHAVGGPRPGSVIKAASKLITADFTTMEKTLTETLDKLADELLSKEQGVVVSLSARPYSDLDYSDGRNGPAETKVDGVHQSQLQTLTRKELEFVAWLNYLSAIADNERKRQELAINVDEESATKLADMASELGREITNRRRECASNAASRACLTPPNIPMDFLKALPAPFPTATFEFFSESTQLLERDSSPLRDDNTMKIGVRPSVIAAMADGNDIERASVAVEARSASGRAIEHARLTVNGKNVRNHPVPVCRIVANVAKPVVLLLQTEPSTFDAGIDRSDANVCERIHFNFVDFLPHLPGGGIYDRELWLSVRDVDTMSWGESPRWFQFSLYWARMDSSKPASEKVIGEKIFWSPTGMLCLDQNMSCENRVSFDEIVWRADLLARGPVQN